MPDVRSVGSRPLRAPVLLAHDYLTQRGGAERVVLSISNVFPAAPILTSVYSPAATYSGFAERQVVTTSLQRWGVLVKDHRLGLPVYARTWNRLRVEADVAICSTSGWAHGLNVDGTKVLYVHNTARWLYRPSDHMERWPRPMRSAFGFGTRRLRRWDREGGRSADLVLANSRQVQARILTEWGVDSEVLYPGHGADLAGQQVPVPGIDEGFVLAVARLLPYKRVGVLLEAMRELPDLRLVVVGTGPESARLRGMAPANATFLGSVADTQLRWLYSHCLCLASVATEDFGLTPLEAMAFGRPVAVLRAGGFAETILDEETGFFFEEATPAAVVRALTRLRRTEWDHPAIAEYAARFSPAVFESRIRDLVGALRRSDQ